MTYSYHTKYNEKLVAILCLNVVVCYSAPHCQSQSVLRDHQDFSGREKEPPSSPASPIGFLPSLSLSLCLSHPSHFFSSVSFHFSCWTSFVSIKRWWNSFWDLCSLVIWLLLSDWQRQHTCCVHNGFLLTSLTFIEQDSVNSLWLATATCIELSELPYFIFIFTDTSLPWFWNHTEDFHYMWCSDGIDQPRPFEEVPPIFRIVTYTWVCHMQRYQTYVQEGIIEWIGKDCFKVVAVPQVIESIATRSVGSSTPPWHMFCLWARHWIQIAFDECVCLHRKCKLPPFFFLCVARGADKKTLGEKGVKTCNKGHVAKAL